MKLTKVNNFLAFFLYRYFAILSLCYATILITGRIGDSDLLLANRRDQISTAIEGRTAIAMNIFSAINFITSNDYLIIAILTALSSSIIYFTCRNFVDNRNVKYWILLLICPGFLIYTNAPSKELIFFYLATFYIILESKFLVLKEKNKFKNLIYLILKLSIIPFLLYWRSFLAAPYLFLSIFSIFIKVFSLGKFTKKLNLRNTLIFTFFISAMTFFLLSQFNTSQYSSTNFEWNFNFLIRSLNTNTSLFRSFIDYEFITNPINSFYVQFLAFFPTMDELINKPYQFLIVIDSLILIYVFFCSWKNLFKTIKNDYRARKIVFIIFTIISFSYFALYGSIGSLNIGASQRFRINFIPIGIIFPLVLENNIEKKSRIKSK